MLFATKLIYSQVSGETPSIFNDLLKPMDKEFSNLTAFATIRVHRFYKDDCHWVDVCHWESIKDHSSHCYVLGTCEDRKKCLNVRDCAPSKLLMYLRLEYPGILSQMTQEERLCAQQGKHLEESPFLQEDSDTEDTIEVNHPE